MYIAQCKLIWAISFWRLYEKLKYVVKFYPRSNLITGRSVSSSLRLKICGKMIPFNYQIVFIEFFEFSMKF